MSLYNYISEGNEIVFATRIGLCTGSTFAATDTISVARIGYNSVLDRIMLKGNAAPISSLTYDFDLVAKTGTDTYTMIIANIIKGAVATTTTAAIPVSKLDAAVPDLFSKPLGIVLEDAIKKAPDKVLNTEIFGSYTLMVRASGATLTANHVQAIFSYVINSN